MFCPCVMIIGHTKDADSGQVLTYYQDPKQGNLGMHMGLPCQAPGWHIYIPSTGEIFNSHDVVIDEDFLSTMSYIQVYLPERVKFQPPCNLPTVTFQDVEYADEPLKLLTNNHSCNPCPATKTYQSMNILTQMDMNLRRRTHQTFYILPNS